MRIKNQIFMQLREANRYACAKNPHLRRLAVVLLDNIIEFQLWRKADRAFLFEKPSVSCDGSDRFCSDQ